MDFLSYPLAIAGLLFLILAYNQWGTKGNSPPEPSGAWPLIGHLHLLGGQKPVAQNLANLADKYGSIFSIRLGVHRTIVISSWEAVKECFTHNDRKFAARPVSTHGKYLGYDHAAFGFASYGPYWREMRKLALIEVLSTRRLEKLRQVRVSELEDCIKELCNLIASKNNGEVVTISHWLEQSILNIIVRTIAGKRYSSTTDGLEDEEARRFRTVIKEFMHVSGDFVLSDAIPLPFLRWMDLQGNIKKMKRISEELDSIFEGWLREHVERRAKSEAVDGEELHDFLDVLISVIDDKFSFLYSRETIIKATAMNLILAGSDSTAVHLEWLLSLLLNKRDVLKYAQEEIEIKVGKNRWVQESDIPNLVYLQAIVKEGLRLYPPGPLAVPHEAMEDCRVGGFHIPKGTRLFVNVWKLHRDPRVWTDPEEFRPERFLSDHADVDVSGQHYEFIPFGSGRRSCPGIQFASLVTHLTLARLIQGFEFRTVANEPVDMTEGMGVTLPRATPLEVLITLRLPSQFYIKEN
uniref:Cytochrome P450 n=1 Tax=Nothapodytes nimmoniana TaxID=159386 RepID=A0A7L7RB91_NOTNI|nr:cytochrome P450 [Nothapodytes nimmoniana]